MLMGMDHKDLTLSNSQQSRSDDHSSSPSTDFAFFWGGASKSYHVIPPGSLHLEAQRKRRM